MTEIVKNMVELSGMFQTLEVKVEDGFRRVDEKIDSLGRLLDERIGALDYRLDEKIDLVSGRLKDEMDRLQTSMDVVLSETRLLRSDWSTQFAHLTDRLTGLTVDVERLKRPTNS